MKGGIMMTNALQRTSEDITEIYNRHVSTVYKICFMFLKNRADTEDAVQATFLKLINYKQTFCNAEHEKAWLIVTAQNQCRNILKHWWARKRDDLSMDADYPTSVEHHDETLEQVLLLPGKYKIPIYLFYYEGYSTKEISEILKIKESTIRSQLHTGRKKLKFYLGGDNFE
jgi:RNA polymerase sigma-70 factor (ECF subfamily)